MTESGYSIFTHAQYPDNGRTVAHKEHANAIQSVKSDVVPPDESAVFGGTNSRRNKPERGWAVELGLGLGPAFNKRRKASE